MVTTERVDLHTHTTCSDGSLTPVELLERAARNQVAAMSITDHDTVEAYLDNSAQASADRLGIELVPGIEISTETRDGKRLHVLGLFIDPQAREVHELVQQQRNSRNQYAATVVDMLLADGWQIDTETLFATLTLTKAHIADSVLSDAENRQKTLHEFGATPTRGQFIEKLMNKGQPFYVERHAIEPAAAIDTIHYVGGVAVLAHPMANVQEGIMNYSELRRLVKALRFDAIEAIYYYFNKSRGDREIDEVDRYMKLARESGLLVSGGSDYHGESTSIGRHVDVGMREKEIYPSLELLQGLRERAAVLRKG